MLKRPHLFWTSSWIALRRAGRDKRARSTVLKLSLLFLALVGYALCIVCTAVVGGIWMAVFYVFIFGTGITAAILMRKWHRKEDELLNYSLTGQVRRYANGGINTQVRVYLEDRAFIVASLLARCGSEVQVKRSQGQEAGENFTRQALNGFLREHGLWDKLEAEEASLASAADGRWCSADEGLVFDWSEQLRLLRWVLGVDAEIVPLWLCPGLDFNLAWDLLQQVTTMRGRNSDVGAWDIRAERDTALGYVARVAAEFRARGAGPDGSEFDKWADEFRASCLGASVDLLSGARTIEETDDDALRSLGLLAVARERYAGYLLEQVDAPEPFAFSAWEADRATPI